MFKLKFRDSDPNMFSLKLNTALRKDFGLRAFGLCCHRIDPLQFIIQIFCRQAEIGTYRQWSKYIFPLKFGIG